MAIVEEVHINDEGTIFRITINDCDADGVQSPLDVSAATLLELIFKSPTGVLKTMSASLTTDGTDGKIEYTTITNDMDEIGNWRLQARVEFSSGKWKSDIGSFRVHENL